MSITFSKVNVFIQDTQILHNISLDLTNRRIACVGCNGSGKSTLARTACGLLPITSGSINIHGITQKKSIWKHVNMCFQIPERQIIMPSVSQEIRFGLENAQFSVQDIEEKIDYALSVLQVQANKPCHSLSEGKKRMLCLLSILLLEPQTIFLDEPTTFLDIPNEKKLLSFLETVKQQIVFITQDVNIVKEFKAAFCIHKGKIKCQGNGTDVIKEYKKLW